MESMVSGFHFASVCFNCGLSGCFRLYLTCAFVEFLCVFGRFRCLYFVSSHSDIRFIYIVVSAFMVIFVSSPDPAYSVILW